MNFETGGLVLETLLCECAGWKFWVPASCMNFWMVPLQYRVLYMSTCGLLWTGYLSYTSN